MLGAGCWVLGDVTVCAEGIENTHPQVTLSLKDLKKPLKIKYVGGGEEGLDMGGVQKEFFQLVMEKVGMFLVFLVDVSA